MVAACSMQPYCAYLKRAICVYVVILKCMCIRMYTEMYMYMYILIIYTLDYCLE